MEKKDHREQKSRPPAKRPPVNPVNPTPMQQLDGFFQSEPFRGVLDSIDAFFQQRALFPASFPVDVYETDSEWVVKAELPGARRENIHIELLGDRIKIALTNDVDTEETNDVHNYYYRERRVDHSERVVPLPYTIYKQRTKAVFKNGVLEIRGPKYPKTRNTLDIE